MPIPKNPICKFLPCRQTGHISNLFGFTLVELMIAISIVAILTAAAIPSFTDFSKSQTFTQTFKTLKSDLRIAQSRAISGSTFGGSSQAWGIRFVNGANQYTVFVCTPAATLSDYLLYTYGSARCPIAANTVKTVSLGSNTSLTGLTPTTVDVVFDSQNGAVYANGSVPAANISVTLTNGTSSSSVQISPAGGIIE